MKKLIVILAVLTMLLSGCQFIPELPEIFGNTLITVNPTEDHDTQRLTEYLIKESIAQDAAANSTVESEIPETTEVPATVAEIPEVTAPPVMADPNNSFINNSNCYFDENAVSIRPKHVYWEGDMLVAECFVINGLYQTVYDITVNELSFENIACASFGDMEGAVIGARSYIVWTFCFSADVIQQFNADLSSLHYYSNVSYSY